MPSLQNLINPDKKQVGQNIDNQWEIQSAVDAEKKGAPDLWDLAKSAADSAYVNGVGFKTIGRMFDDSDVSYTEDQLNQIYPDAPKGFFKGGATAYQAEMLYDKLSKGQEVEMLKNMIYGNEDTSTPDWWVIGRKGRNLVPVISSIATSFADPVTIPAMLLGGAVADKALPFASRFAPEVTKRVAMSIGTSRLASNWVPEILQNLAYEATANYGLNKVNASYTKEDPTIKEALVNSVGTALLFGTASALFKGYNVRYLNNSALHVSDAIEGGFKLNKDMASAALRSGTHNIHVLNEAIKDYVTNPTESTKGITDKIFNRSMKYSGEESFDAMGSKFVGVIDPEGNTLYTGARHGDNHIFIDDHKAVQGMVNEYNLNGDANLKVVTSEQLNLGQLKLADLDSELASSHPDVLNVIESHIGSINDLNIKDDATLADVFKSIDDAVATSDMSGADVVKMYDDISKTIESKGYDGMTHIAEVDGKAHAVAEVFPDKLGGVDSLGDATPTDTMKPTSDPIDADITVVGGETIPAEPTLHDPALELDDDFKTNYQKFNDPEYIKQTEVDDFSKFVEDDLTIKEDEIKADLSADDVLVEQDGAGAKNNSQFKELVDSAKEQYKSDAPEKANEIFKVLENCKGKS